MDYFTESFPYIEIGELDLVSGEIRNVPLIPISEAPSRAKMIVREGDIIVSTTRPSRGAISFLKEPDEPVQIASTGFCVLREVISENVSKDFIYLALREGFSLSQMEQRSSGGNYPAITSEELKRILIPVPSETVQTLALEVFANARDARRQKNLQAAEKLASIDGVVLDALGIELPERDDGALEKRIFYTKSNAVTGRRVDPEARHKERISAVEAIRAGRFPTERLRDAAVFIKKQVSENPHALPYVGLESIDGNTGFYTPNLEIEEFGSANLFEAGQVLFPKLRPYLNKVFLTNFNGVCSTEFHVLEGKSVSSAFLAAFLRNEIVVRQTKRLMTGNTLPRLQTDDIESLLIPLPPPAVQAKIVEKVDALYAAAKQLRREGDEILANAKAEVERMILGDRIDP